MLAGKLWWYYDWHTVNISEWHCLFSFLHCLPIDWNNLVLPWLSVVYSGLLSLLTVGGLKLCKCRTYERIYYRCIMHQRITASSNNIHRWGTESTAYVDRHCGVKYCLWCPEMNQQCYLMPSDPNNPCGRNYKGSVSSDWASLFNLLQHEAGHFVVVLKRENTPL